MIEFAVLGALVLVPLAYDGRGWLVISQQPKHFVLHLAAAVILIAWSIEIAISSDQPRIRTWPGRSPARWAVIAAAIFAIVGMLSTAFSRVPMASLWGRDFMFSHGYELYSFLAYLVLFMAVAIRLRGRDKVQRIIYVIVGTATVASIYGVGQHFGWDPYGPGEGQNRITSTFLNPLNLASFLAMSLPITMAAAFLKRADNRWWILFAIPIGLQIAALLFSGSRGPLIGATAGMIVLISVAILRLERTILLRGLAIAIGGIVLAGVLVTAPLGDSRGTRDVFGGFAETATVAASLVGVAPVADSAFTNRVGIWRGAVKLTANWDAEPPETGILSILRPIFGFGPTMYKYSYPLTVEPDGPRNAEHPHNYALQVLLELGFAGLVALVIFAGFILIAILRLLWSKRSIQADPWFTVVAVGFSAVFVGRVVGEMSGVARMSDLVPFWILTGLVVAVSESVAREPVAPTMAPDRQKPLNPRTYASARGLIRIGVAILVIGVVAGAFISKDIQQLRGARAIVGAVGLINSGQPTEGLREFERGIDLAPDVTDYPILLDRWLGGERPATSPENEKAILDVRYRVLSKAANGDPYNFTLRERLAEITAALFQSGENERRAEVIERYADLARAFPNYSDYQALAATQLLAFDAYDDVLTTSDRWIALGNHDGSLAEAWWVRGVALVGLGDDAGAFDSFESATEVRPENSWSGVAHGALATMLEENGEIERASVHRALQDGLKNK